MHSATVSRKLSLFLVGAIVATLCAVASSSAQIVHASGSGSVDYAPTFTGSTTFSANDNATFDFLSNFTFEAWIKPTSTCMSGGTNCMVVNKENNFEIWITNGLVSYAITNSVGTWVVGSTNVPVRQDVWQHIAWTVERSTNSVNIYINGGLAFAPTSSASVVATTGSDSNQPFTLGGRSGNSFDRYYGQLDEVRMYTNVRSQANIQSDMNLYGTAAGADTTGLTLYYDFNVGTGTSLTNDAPGATSATTLTGNTTFTWNDIKTTTATSASTLITFPRSYLTSTGGWTVPAGVTKVDALIVGGGGGGGGGSYNTLGAGGGGAGGGGGQVRTITNTSVTPNATTAVVVGAGGTQGLGSNSSRTLASYGTSWNGMYGYNGQDSSFLSTTSSKGLGGSGGGWNKNGTTWIDGYGGDFGGTSGSGNLGGNRSVSAGAGGGGQAAASTNINGAAGTLVSGYGIDSTYLGAGGGGGAASGVTAGTAGSATSGAGSNTGDGGNATMNYGGGGGGGRGGPQSSAGSHGGHGASGVVIVKYANVSTIASTNRSYAWANNTSNRITIPDNTAIDLSTDFTVELWVNPSLIDGTNRPFMAKELAYGFEVTTAAVAGGTGNVKYAFSGAWNWYGTGIDISANTWTHLAFVRSGSTLTTYKNGGTIAGGSESTVTGNGIDSAIANTTGDLTLGSRTAYSSENYQGNMDEVRIWSGARTASDIALNYKKQVAADVGYWAFDEDSGSIAYNGAATTGSSLNGTVASLTSSTASVAPVNASLTAGYYSGYLPGYDAASSPSRSFSITGSPTKGTATVNSTTGAFTYTPNSNATGTDTVTYTVTGAYGSSSSSITLENPTSPLPSALSFTQGSAITATVNSATNLGFGTSQATAYTNGETIQATVTTTNGSVTATASGSATLSGQNTTSFTVYGTQTDVNNTLNSATVTSSSSKPGRVTLDIAMRGVNQTINSRTYTYNSNGHFYTLVTSGASTWTSAVTTASAMTLGSRPGYLVTISSSAEQSTVNTVLGANSAWFGITDSVVEGTWMWTGSDIGYQFWSGVANGTTVKGRYTNWSANEPNDYGTGEDYGNLNSGGSWNDCSNTCAVSNALVEFDPVQTRLVKNLNYANASALTATINTAKSLNYGSTFIDTATWNKGETVQITLSASAGTLSATTTGLTASGSGTATMTLEGTVANINTALNTATVTTTSNGSTSVTITYGVKCVTTGSYYCNSANNHFYFSGASAVNATAKTNAEAAYFAGTNGYLGTVTDAVEEKFIRTNFTATTTWFGLSDSVAEGQMAYNAPDAYANVSQGEKALGSSFANWATPEPNSSGNNVVLRYGTGNAFWDDQADTSIPSVQEFAPITTTVTTNITTIGAPTITTPNSGLSGTVNTAYSLAISATSGLSPLSYAVASGTLPDGLTISSSTGTISGTPTTAPQSKAITVRVTDANGATATTSSFTLTISANTCASPTSTTVGLDTVLKFTSTGYCTWTVPAGVTTIDAFLVGGGGGGGGDGGSGGGGGALQPVNGISVTPGDVLTLRIGAGGAIGTHASAVGSGGVTADAGNGSASSIATNSTTIATANGGTGGRTGPSSYAGGAGGTSTNGYAGAQGGTASSGVGNYGGAGKDGGVNYYFGTANYYGGGGAGGEYDNGSMTIVVQGGVGGGGNAGTRVGSSHTNGSAGTANTGGGGGAGVAGSPQTNGGLGADGVVLIRYATDSLNAFPADISNMYMRYQADDYQAVDTSRRSWVDSSNNARHATASGTISTANVTNNGSTATVRTLSGDTTSRVTFSTFPSTYTMFHVARYSGSNKQRIFTSDATSNWLSGFWQAKTGMAYHNNWLTGNTSTYASTNAWLLSSDQINAYRYNGKTITPSGNAQSYAATIGINLMTYSGGPQELSEWQSPEVIVYNRALSATEIRRVEAYLVRRYSLLGYDAAETDTGILSVSNLTFAKQGTASTGQTDRLTASWTSPSDLTTVSDITVEFKKSSDSTWTTWSHAVNKNLTSAVITGLTPGTQYDVRVTPVDTDVTVTNRPSRSVTQVTTWLDSTVTLGSMPSSPRSGSTYSLQATATSGTTGTVKFYANSTLITGCEAVTLLSSVATCSWTPATAGNFDITATYVGDSVYLQSSTASASSVTVGNALCSPTSTASGRFTVLKFLTAQTCDYSSLPSGVESVDVLVVGGGGGGGENVGQGGNGGGGYYAERVSADNTSAMVITTGAGGAGGAYYVNNANDGTTATTLRDGAAGGNSSFVLGATTLTGTGGAGGQTIWSDNKCGGAGVNSTQAARSSGSGTGGTSLTGGLGGLEGLSYGGTPTAGGDGFSNSITGSATSYGGGGGGGGWGVNGANGGAGGGGKGNTGTSAGVAGTANTGGGGGGGSDGCKQGGNGGSGIVMIRYAAVPTISTQPASVSKASGTSQTFSVTPTATGAVAGDFTYQWRKNGVNISGATSSSYTISSVLSTDAGTYSVVVKNSSTSGAVSTVTSADATLTVTKTSQTITFGSLSDRVYGVSPFTVSATASSSLTVAFSSTTTSVCTVSGTTVTVINTGTCTIAADQAGNTEYNAATQVTQGFTVTTKSLTVSGVTAANKTYDRSTTATPSFSGASLVGVVGSDVVSLVSNAATATFDNVNVGTNKTVTVASNSISLNGAQSSRYSLSTITTTADITAKELTVTGMSAANKTYDRTTTATVTGTPALVGVISGDTVTAAATSPTGTFASQDVANGISVQVGGVTIGGTHSGNYTVTQPTVTANITPKSLTISGVTANNKVYDRTNSATLTFTSPTLTGVISGDTVAPETGLATATFNSRDVANGIAVTVSGITLSGAQAGNYSLTQPTPTANITKKTITVSGITGVDKMYDGTRSASVTYGSATLSGVISPDIATLSTGGVTAQFRTTSYGTNKTIDVTGLAVTGAQSGNYTVADSTATANIVKRSLTITGITTLSAMTYNGDTDAFSVIDTSLAALSGVQGSDVITANYDLLSAQFSDKNVGTGKTITIDGITVSGTNVANYTFVQPTDVTGEISVASLTVINITASDKVYDGTRTATLNKDSAALSGVVFGDTVTLSVSGVTGTFSSKDAGTRPVSTTGATISGNDAGNYTLNQASTTATISQKQLTVTGITATSRTYNGGTTAAIVKTGAALVGVIGNEDVTLNTSAATSGRFSDKNYGVGKTVYVDNLTLSGTATANYTLAPYTTTASIYKKALTITGITASNKQYDQSTTAQLVKTSPALVGVIAADVGKVTLSTTNAAGTFASVDVGTGISVAVTGNTISGLESGNYTLTQPSLTADITPIALTVTGITARNKVYDKSTSATSLLNLQGKTLNGVLQGDDVTINTDTVIAAFSDELADTGKTVYITQISVDGAQSGNYTVTQPVTTADITKRELTVSGIVATSRQYNGTTSVSLVTTGASLVNAMSGDDVTLNSLNVSGSVADSSVGNNKLVTISGLTLNGADKTNYSLTQPTATVNITIAPAGLTWATPQAITYGDLLGSGILNATASVAGTFTYTPTSGTRLSYGTHTLSVTFTPVDPGFNTETTSVSISVGKKTISAINFITTNRVYNASTDATSLIDTTQVSLSGVESGDTVSLGGTLRGEFATKDIGTNKAITLSGYILSGAQSSNYSLQLPTLHANVTAKHLSIQNVTANNKVYNGNTIASLTYGPATSSDIESGDTVTIDTSNASATFSDANVGSNKTVTVAGIAATGTDFGNYIVDQPVLAASISQASAGLAWSNPADIEFATSLGATQQNATAQQGGTFTYSPTPGTRLNVGTHTLSVTFTPNSSNYAVASTSVSITVTPKALTVTATSDTTTYGSTFTSAFSTSGLASGDIADTVTYTYAGTGGTNYSASTTRPTAAGSYSITPSNFTLSSGLLTNYSVTYVDGTHTINKSTQAALIASASSTQVVYEPSPQSPTINLSTTGGSGDGAVTYALSPSTSLCSISGSVLTVLGAGSCSVVATKAEGTNHLATTSASITIDIAKSDQTLTLASINPKTYGDPTFTAITSATSGLTVSITATPSTVCEVVSGHTVRINGNGNCTLTASQSGDANYNPATAAIGSATSRTFTIAKKNLTISGVVAQNKVYDATTSATSLLDFSNSSLVGVVSGDDVSRDTSLISATFASKSIGDAKAITITGLTLTGNQSSKYSISIPTYVTANITPATLTVTGITVPTRAYNSTTTATLDTSSYQFTGVQLQDNVHLDDSAYVATYNNAGTATNKVVTVTNLLLSGADADNYVLTQPVLQGDIVKASALIAFASSRSDTYNGTPRALSSSTTPSGLSVTTLYSGTGSTTYASTQTAPTNAGTYNVAAAIADVNYEGTATSSWTINKKTMTVTFNSSLTRIFTGNPHSVSASTSLANNVTVHYLGVDGTTYNSSFAPTNAGTYTVTAQVVEANYDGSAQETLTVDPAQQSAITFGNNNSFVFGTNLQLVTLGGSGSGEYSYEIVSGDCTVDSTNEILQAQNAGSCVVRAHRAASANYLAATSANFTVTVRKANQALSFTSALPSNPVKDSTYTPTATSTSGLTPTLTVTAGLNTSCSMTNGVIKFLAAGLCEISANQSGSANYNAATTITQSLEVGKLSQEISFVQPPVLTMKDTATTLMASASSGLSVSFAITSGNTHCSIDQYGTLSVISTGTCTVLASQAGNNIYSPAGSISRVVSIAPEIPGAPHIVSVSSGDGSVTVGYLAPFSNGGSPIIGYAVTATSTNSPTISRNDCGTATLSCTLTGLVNGHSYSVTVSAINAAGNSPESDSEEVLIPAPTLEAVVNVAGTRQLTSMDIVWEDPSSFGDGTFVRYDVYLRSRGSTYSAPVTVQSFSESGISFIPNTHRSTLVRALSTTSRTVHFDNLDPSLTYESKIVTVTSVTTAETSTNTAQAVVLPLKNPAVPRNLTFDSPTGTTAHVTWATPLYDGGQAVQSYTVTSSTGTCTMSSQLATSCTLLNLQPGTQVTVHVKATNAVGDSLPASLTATTPQAPSAPSIYTVAASPTSLTPTWIAGDNGGRPITSYLVTAISITDASDNGQCSTTVLTCVIHGLKANTNYDVRVRAVNSVGAGSNSASYTTKTAIPVSSAWAAFKVSTDASVGAQLLNQLPPAPARVSTLSLSGNRTRVIAVRATKDAAIPVSYAIISITQRLNGSLIARIKVQVDPSDPTTTVTVPYASKKVRVSVQFANSIGLSAGGKAGQNVSEGQTLDDTTIAGKTRVIGDEAPSDLFFERGSSKVSAPMKKKLNAIARLIKNRSGLVYVTGFAQKGELKSAWLLDSLARARGKAIAQYLSTLGVRQWITYSGTSTTDINWESTQTRRVVISTASQQD